MDFRLLKKRDNKMFHFPIGYRGGPGFGPVIWTVLIHDPMTHSSQWKQMELLNDEVERQIFIGRFDDTTWGGLSQPEMEFWNAKGFNFDTWKGKPIYLGDIVRYICEGKADVVEVVRLMHLVCFKDKGGCVKDMPMDDKRCKMYVLGNSTQNSELLEGIKN